MAEQVPARNGGTLTRPAKGEVMNPKGKPKGTVNFKTIAEKILDGVITVEEAGEKMKITRRELMILKIINEAINGEEPSIRLKAAQFVIEKIEGKAIETVQQTVTFSQPDVMTDSQINAIIKALS